MAKKQKPEADVAATCAELQALQRRRVVVQKSRIMMVNNLRAAVATHLGYRSGLDPAERKKSFEEAALHVTATLAGEESSCRDLILATHQGIDAFTAHEEGVDEAMKRLAKVLPVTAWLKERAQCGFGILSLAKVIGEAGDLSNYSNPGKLWKRMGLAPYTHKGVTRAGSTWRMKKKEAVSAGLDWEGMGYCPRRRSLAYLIGEGLMKLNFKKNDEEVIWRGPYRARYEQAKEVMRTNHEKSPEYPDARSHKHAIGMAAKLLLKNLWAQWTGKLEEPDWRTR